MPQNILIEGVCPLMTRMIHFVMKTFSASFFQIPNFPFFSKFFKCSLNWGDFGSFHDSSKDSDLSHEIMHKTSEYWALILLSKCTSSLPFSQQTNTLILLEFFLPKIQKGVPTQKFNSILWCIYIFGYADFLNIHLKEWTQLSTSI